MAVFRQYGLVKEIQISDGFDTRHAFTFAFVEMATVQAEKAAIEGLRKFNLLGRELILSKSQVPASILTLD